MRNFRKAIVLMMFFCLAFSWNILALGQEPIETVDWKKLTDFFIEIFGWDKSGDAIGSNMSMGMETVGRAEQEYKSGKRSLMIQIIDSAKSMMVLMPIKTLMMNNMKTSQEYVEKITTNGFPGMKTYNYSKKQVGVIVLILERFVLQTDGYNFSEEEVSELVEAAKNHDLEGIAKLGK